ncbi:hypothetical protein MTO96_007184 [Rhipicephalus appendiculatus]
MRFRGRGDHGTDRQHEFSRPKPSGATRYSAFKEHLSKKTKKQLLRLNSADWQLYRYFAKVFDENVKEFGVDRMAAEVKRLRAKQREYYDRCAMAEVPIKELYPHYKREDVVTLKYKDNSKLCRHLTLDELAFHEEVKKMQQVRVRRYLAHQKQARSSSSSFKHVTKGVAARTSTS